MPKGKPTRGRQHKVRVKPRTHATSQGMKQYVFVPRRIAGRPPRLTKELLNEFLHALRSSFFLETAYAATGLNYFTVRQWRLRGKREEDRITQGGKPDKHEELFLRFYLGCKQTLATVEIEVVSSIRVHALAYWQAGAWLLERKFPQRWSAQKETIKELASVVQELAEKLAAFKVTPNPSTPGEPGHG